MSRTWVHQPWWVKERDPRWRDHFQEIHNHDKGVCTLADYLANRANYIGGRCHISWCWRGRQVHCGCRMCSAHWSRRSLRRWERHQAHLALVAEDWDRAMLHFPAYYRG